MPSLGNDSFPLDGFGRRLGLVAHGRCLRGALDSVAPEVFPHVGRSLHDGTWHYPGAYDRDPVRMHGTAPCLVDVERSRDRNLHYDSGARWGAETSTEALVGTFGEEPFTMVTSRRTFRNPRVCEGTKASSATPDAATVVVMPVVV